MVLLLLSLKEQMILSVDLWTSLVLKSALWNSREPECTTASVHPAGRKGGREDGGSCRCWDAAAAGRPSCPEVEERRETPGKSQASAR